MKNSAELSAVITDIKRFAIHDGPGIRTTFFLKGCPLKCIWCHNPEAISARPQMVCYQHRCVACGNCIPACPAGAQSMADGEHLHLIDKCTACGACETVCLGGALKFYGRTLMLEEALKTALEDVDFYRESGGGVTISGGEPLMQSDFTLAFLAALKKENIHTALDTCLFVRQEHLKAALPVTDVFLVDFKHPDPVRHKELTGRSNERIKENLEFLAANGAKIAIRIPFVPGCNTALAEVEETGKYLSRFRLEEVRLLAYHSMARSKYAALQIPDTMPDVPSPAETKLKAAVAVLKNYGIPAMY